MSDFDRFQQTLVENEFDKPGVDYDVFIAAANSLRVDAGMRPVGHKLTLDFFLGQRSIDALAGWHKPKRVPA